MAFQVSDFEGYSLSTEGERCKYRERTVETGKLYSVRDYEPCKAYPNGVRFFMVNCQHVEALPNTPGTRALLLAVQNG